MPETFSIVCISPQDWREELPTNRQQIMRRAAGQGHPVLFVETGYFVGRHLWRILRGPDRGSLARRLFATEGVAPRIRVQKAFNLLPWGQKYSALNRVNTALTAWLIRRRAARLPSRHVLWIYDPGLPGLVGACGEALAVYDCVDDYAEQAISPRRRALVAAGDHATAENARLVFTTSKTMYQRQLQVNADTHLVPNVGDFAHFAPAADRSFAAPEVAGLDRPVIGFAGNFLTTKVDFGLLEHVARAHPEWTVLLIGPSRPDSADRLERLRVLPNVRWLGPKAYADLPRFVAAFDVALIPYLSNDYTRSCFPLKLYEYLAAGKPVVASGLPELAGLEPYVVLADTPAELVGAVEAALLRLGEDERSARVELAARNTWETRASTLLGLVTAALEA
jgi:glycosyltransferase involved in cell wall biosynthesis